MKYKDALPQETLLKVTDYFTNKLGQHFSCKSSHESSVAHSFVLADRDIGFAVNGKGVSKELALASAYGEFCERIFNRCFVRFNQMDLSELKNYAPDYKEISRNDLIDQINKLLMLEGFDSSRREPIYENVMALIDASQPYGYNQYLCIPFSSHDGDEVLIPVSVCDYYLGTNGMAAGNTYYEAFVQAYSEITERLAIRDINAGKITPSLVPDEDIERSPYLKEAIHSLQKSYPCKILLFTFEQIYDYPVACVLLIDESNMRFRFRFGAHCTIHYALERCITEMLQGATLYDKTKWSSIADICLSETGQTFQIYLDGSGVLSRVALERLLSANSYCHTNWFPVTNEEAYYSIIKTKKTIFVKNNSYTPLSTMQLYIPQWSFIRDFENDDPMPYLKRLTFSNQFRHIFSARDHVNVSHVYDLIREFKAEFSRNSTLSDVLMGLCPIQKQYLKHVSFSDLVCVLDMKEGRGESVHRYYKNKLRVDDSPYVSYATIRTYYDLVGEKIPRELECLFPDDIVESVTADLHNNPSWILSLGYCKQCPQRNQNSCINTAKKVLCEHINNEVINHENDVIREF